MFFLYLLIKPYKMKMNRFLQSGNKYFAFCFDIPSFLMCSVANFTQACYRKR